MSTLLYRGNALLRRFVYRSPWIARTAWHARVAPFEGISFWELGSLAVRRALATELRPGMRALEVGTGPYAIVALWAARRFSITLAVTELDPGAAAAARRAVADNHAAITVHCGDLFADAPGPFDVIWFVPPATPAATVERQVSSAPPAARELWRLRADGGEHGWELLARFLTGAPARLSPNGKIVFAINRHHVPLERARALVDEAGLAVVREVRLPLVPHVAIVARVASVVPVSSR